MTAVVVDCVRDEQALLELRASWNELASRCAHDSVFLRHEWFDASWQWLRNEPDGVQLAVLCVRADERLIGICPLLLRKRRVHSFTARTLEFLSVPDAQLTNL